MTGLSFEAGLAGIISSARARVAATRRTAFEVVIDFDNGQRGVNGAYSIALHHAAGSVGPGAPRVQPFISAGVTGWFSRLRMAEQRITLASEETLIVPP